VKKTINIIHYHLHPGGVTSIIKSQVESLLKDKNYAVKIFCGYCENPNEYQKPGAHLLTYPALNYLPEDLEPEDILDLYQYIKEIFKTNIKGANEVLHFHNLNLGKNPVLTHVIYQLATEGFRIVNHTHDFAEDRPDRMEFHDKILGQNFHVDPFDVMYPGYRNYEYITLNSADRERIMDQGIRPEQVTKIPNPVSTNHGSGEMDKKKAVTEIMEDLNLQSDKKLVIYPVRVIRRKNIGEFILFSVLFGQEAHWLVTQSPKNPVEVKPYEAWKNFCAKHHIPVVFEAGQKTDFSKLMIAADLCLTTSTDEGFGMVFLEPWIYGTQVKGRDIPRVTSDLKADGLEFPLLYRQLRVKLDDEMKDFAELTVEEQRDVILKTRNDDLFKAQLIRMNPFIRQLLEKPKDGTLEKNQEIIKSKYSLKNYKEQLDAVYKRLFEKA
jgi:glycosyltransferase involved in cell wall biosynthesis